MSSKLISVVIVGARGRMGQELIRAVIESDDLTIVGAVDRSGAPGFGQDVGRLVGLPHAGIEVNDELRPPRGSVVVDFSLPEATDNNVMRCLEVGVPLVLGTTGISAASRSRIAEAARQIPIVSAANFSVGVTVLARLSALAARALGQQWEAEIVELHHRHKRDAPSGTALRLAEAVAGAKGLDSERDVVRDRGTKAGPRTQDEIGVATLRGGDSIGEHTVLLLGDGERLELTHRARERGIFAAGALRAARWIHDRQPGLYDMADVLGLAAL